jgi:hypothetical protein
VCACREGSEYRGHDQGSTGAHDPAIATARRVSGSSLCLSEDANQLHEVGQSHMVGNPPGPSSQKASNKGVRREWPGRGHVVAQRLQVPDAESRTRYQGRSNTHGYVTEAPAALRGLELMDSPMDKIHADQYD